MTYLLINTGLKIIFISIFAMFAIYKDYQKEAMQLFLIFFISGQLAAYLLDLDLLKIVIPIATDTRTGTVTQLISSTLFPFLLAFTIRDLKAAKQGFEYGFYIRLMFLILIVIGFLQFTPFSNFLVSFLLITALGSGSFGLYKKYKKE